MIQLLEKCISAFSTFVLLLAAILKIGTVIHEMRNASSTLLDPIFCMDLTMLLGGRRIIEITIAWYLIFGKNVRAKMFMVLWVSSVFLLYRTGLFLLGVRQSVCNCLGNSFSKSASSAEI